MPKRRENLGVGLGSHCRPGGGIGGWRAIASIGVRWGSTARAAGRMAARDLPCAKAWCLVREPDALVAHVRFDERGVETESWLGY